MDNLLTMLKTDLGILSTTVYDERLLSYLTSAMEAIRKEGAATISPSSPLDAQLIVMYAAWLWRKRDSMEGMPRMLRWQLNNRVLSEKAGGADG
jgi:hypothetical protein